MYIQERNSSPILLTKLTNVGRKAIAQGNMNFTYYSIGDSEIDYKSNSILKLIKNKDNHPKQVSFLEKGDCVRYFPITEEMENVVQLTLRNNARDRGFFDKCIVDTAKLNSSLFKTEGSFRLSLLDGTKILDLTGIILENQFNAINDNDIIMMKIPNLLGVEENSVHDTIFPLNTLYFALTKTNLSGRFEVDRFMPYFSDYDGSDDLIVNYWIMPSKEDALSYYSPSGQTINWNSETLEFFEECYSGDTLVWNMNMPYCANIIGATGCTTDVDNYGSQGYESTLHYLSLCNDCPELSGDKCSDQLESSEYYFNNKTILHFSNFDTRNEYGEFFYIDDSNQFSVCIPNIMWHNRSFSGSTTGDVMGMRFITTSEVKTLYLEDDNIKYHDLIEDVDFISNEPLVVGKVFPDLKIVVIDHPELSNVLSYKSNRTYSLPPLTAKQILPINGTNTGILKRNKRLYMTYTFTSNEGMQNIIPQGVISYLDNVGNIDRDVEFIIKDVDQFPYMRIPINGNYDGNGFFANNMIVLYQITEIGDKPVSDSWQMVDFTTNRILDDIDGVYVDPLKLENRSSYINSFTLTEARVGMNGLGIYANDVFCVSCNTSNLTVGDERFFMGNINTKIGAYIYKKVINVIINERDITKTSNSSHLNEDFLLSELSFYNSDYEQIAVTKTSKPIRLRPNSVTEIEINFDF